MPFGVYHSMMHTVRWLALAAALLLASGCGSDTSQESADCSQQIEYQGIRYTERGFTELEPVEFERVVAVPCMDTGVEPKPDAPAEYRSAFKFTDQDPTEVLAVLVEEGLYRVMLSDSLSGSRASSILKSVGAG